MKKTLLIFTLLVSTVFFSSPSKAGWTKVSENVDGDTIYVDFERIRKHGGYVYYWALSDLLKPDQYGYLSYKVYQQGDCEMFRYKQVSGNYIKKPMGVGLGDSFIPVEKWVYPSHNSIDEAVINTVCSH